MQRGKIHCYLVQGVARGLLSVGSSLAIGEVASMAAPALLETGAQKQAVQSFESYFNRTVVFAYIEKKE